jgi:hypothetical protein
MTYFSIITGVIGIISFLLQMGGIFPEYKKYLSHATTLLFGLTIGMFLQMGASIKIQVPQEISLREFAGISLALGSGLLIFILILTSVVVEDPGKRRTASSAASAVSLFLIFLLMFFWDIILPK